MDDIFSANNLVPFTLIFCISNIAIMIIVIDKMVYIIRNKKKLVTHKTISDIQIFIASFCEFKNNYF